MKFFRCFNIIQAKLTTPYNVTGTLSPLDEESSCMLEHSEPFCLLLCGYDEGVVLCW